MPENVDDVPWRRIPSGTGDRDAIPALLRRLSAGTDDDEPLRKLRGHCFVYFKEVTEAALYLTPYLLDLAATPGLPQRAAILDLMTDVVLGTPAYPYGHAREPDHVALTRAYLVANVADLLKPLDDPDQAVASTTAHLLSHLPEAAPHTTPALRSRVLRARDLPASEDPVVAVACLLALAWTSGPDQHDWFACRFRESDHPDVRAALAVGLARTSPDRPDPEAVRAAADAVAAPDTTFDRLQWCPDGITLIGSAFLPSEHWHQALTRELLTRPGLHATERALLTARESLHHWRATSATLTPLLTDKTRTLLSLHDEKREPGGTGSDGEEEELELAESAVRLLAGSGRAVAGQADFLAGLLDAHLDRQLRQAASPPGHVWPRIEVAAVKGLARVGDGRCVPWVASALLGTRRQLNRLDVLTVLPAVKEHADDLLPALQVIMSDLYSLDWPMDKVIDLLYALPSWGPAAAPLTPAVAALLPQEAMAALPILGAIGPDAREAVPCVREMLDNENHRERAAWALWRITGDPEPAQAILGEAVAEDWFGSGEVFRMLEDLGPLAATTAPRLRDLLRPSVHLPDGERVDVARAHLSDGVRVDVARALWAITGDPDGLVAPLLAAVEARPLDDEDALRAIEALGMIGPAAAPAVPALRPIATGPARVVTDDVWVDERLQQAALQALRAMDA